MNKDSFILYNSFYEPIKSLKNEQLGKLLRSIFNYTINGEITQDNEILVAFMFIKNQIDIDTEKWTIEKNARSEAGKKGMASRWHNNDNNVITNDNKNNNVINAITNITDNVNDNVYVNDNDNVINKKKILKEKKSYGEFNNVLLTDEEYAKLEKSNLLTYIDTLSSYIASKGKKYKSHYATILTWSRNDNKKQEDNKYKGLSFKEQEYLRQEELMEKWVKGE